MPYNTNGYQAPYQNGSYMMPQGQPMQPMQPMQPSYQSNVRGNAPQFGDWVEGEDAARVYPFPPNWPLETPLTLWDINEDVFYVKVKDSLGRPMPLKRARFNWEQTRALLPGQSNNSQSYDNYATKEDLERLENKIIASFNSSRQQAVSAPPANRNGGNRE